MEHESGDAGWRQWLATLTTLADDAGWRQSREGGPT